MQEKRQHPIKHKGPAIRETPARSADPAELRRRAEARLREQEAESGSQRVFHELEVHQIELEMQNAELHIARNELEAALENYTDLYDFAPVGYFSIDDSGAILEVNLTGAALLGVERSRLIRRRFSHFVSEESRPGLQACLEKAFAGSKDVTCDALIVKPGGSTFWAGFRATPTVSPNGNNRSCRVAFGDITASKDAEDARRRLDVMAERNRVLSREIARRLLVEKKLKESDKLKTEWLQHSRHMEVQLRRMAHGILHAQEEERKRISRELHDQVAQTLASINVHLAPLTRGTATNLAGLKKRIARAQRLVSKSMDTVHKFARELRPPVLDDLGLTPALRALMTEFTDRSGVRTSLTAFAQVERMNIVKRTVLYRVAQEALSNVARHAKASRVKLTIQRLRARVRMKIVDDGKSFDVERVMLTRGRKRLGLLGMKERLEMVGGTFRVESAAGKGTTVTAEIPLGKAPPLRHSGSKNVHANSP